MKCARARKLFGAYWDDEITQGEREWLDSHMNACATCRTDYESLARTLETVASLPREEAAPDLLEQTVARARRAATAPDHLPESERRWVPVTAVAAAAVLVVVLVAPRTGWLPSGAPQQTASGGPAFGPVAEPVAVARPMGTSVPVQPNTSAAPGFVSIAGDSLFDHSEDVEFVLDPVALRRGRAHPLPPARSTEGVQVERAVITF
jgi:anti-sigma factor RsiW